MIRFVYDQESENQISLIFQNHTFTKGDWTQQRPKTN